MELDFPVNVRKKRVKVYPPVEIEWIIIKTDEWYNEIYKLIIEDVEEYIDYREAKVHPSLFREMQEYRDSIRPHMRPPNHSCIRVNRLWKKIYEDPLRVY